MERGERVHTAETIGMAQRGGSVASHVRVGKDKPSPLIPKGAADVVIGFEPGEALRSIQYLRRGGVVVVCDRAISAAGGSNGGVYRAADVLRYLDGNADGLGISRLIIVDSEQTALKSVYRALNAALLGAAAASGALGFSPREVLSALTLTVSERFADVNARAFEIGAKTVTPKAES
jgi:indolepyruvate ferredoxin oxidoreductase beta subunit